jgi:hypothetical protein
VPGTVKVLDLLADPPDRPAQDGTDGAAQPVEDVDLDLFPGTFGEGVERGPDGEFRQPLSFGHIAP